MRPEPYPVFGAFVPPQADETYISLTAYDAAYVALAEALGAPLITRDGRMAAAHGHRAKIELIQ